ncbi:M56 family metallopeptidase [Pedobacter nutrimenti]|uniref:Beta-lactamase regulating signal transducer with metallopeptidase domain n=1 Tax=Pedobacter nutrimenti TaxID=1241337 RepID=A0A318UID2_9SPHI|nr:M56 family metallopeptidase [Pedobacter nutrimenti]PYF72844.1 beta-lactamase regulating signal transducer with metallopeptidase domain [Pedobacter nutrimenti]
MEFQFINLFPSNWVNALGLTLFHSLWIGILLALVTSAIILFTKKSSARLRYNLLTATLCLFVLVMGLVFIRSIDAPKQQTVLPQITMNTPAQVLAQPPVIPSSESGLAERAKEVLNLWSLYSYQIVMIWFLIICAKCIQLVAGLHSVHYLKKNNVFDPGRYWEDKITELSEKLGLQKSIRLLQSGLAKVPMTAGHLKPVILMPLGMLNGLSLAEVEAILSHELAHIKRRDYLVNILQSLIEIVFFFNPAILWISRLIREERENCCDDLALTCTDNKQTYIKALISCQEFQSLNPEYAMAFSGKRGQLLGRVSRMVFNKSASLNKVEKTVLTIVLISSVLLTAAFTKDSKTAPVKLVKKEKALESVVILQDSTRKINSTKTSKTITPGAHKTTTATHKEYQNETTVQHKQEQIRLHQEQIRLKQEQIRMAQEDLRMAAEQKRAEAEALRAQHNSNANYNKDYQRYAKDIEHYNQLIAEYSHKTAANANKYAEKANQYAREMAVYTKQQEKYNRKEISVPPTEPTPPTPPSPLTPPTPPTPPTFSTPPSPPTRPAGYRAGDNNTSKTRKSSSLSTSNTSTSALAKTKTPEKEPSMADAIARTLLTDGVISQTRNLSFKFDKEELIVNGVTQPAQIHKRYVQKFLRDNVNRKIESTTTTD